MKQVTIRLLTAVPMPEGLRRPQEGPITVSAELAEKLIKEGAAESTDEEKPAKGKKATPAATSTPSPAPAPSTSPTPAPSDGAD